MPETAPSAQMQEDSTTETDNESIQRDPPVEVFLPVDGQDEEACREAWDKLSDEEWIAKDIRYRAAVKVENEVLAAGYEDAAQAQLEGYFSAGGRHRDMFPVCQDLQKQHPEIGRKELVLRIRVAYTRVTSAGKLSADLRGW
jgi:hypothetical protein